MRLEHRVDKKRYRLRAAAGSYWLLDMQQEGKVEQIPELNESGAMLWKLLEGGMTLQEAAQSVSHTYGIDLESAYADVSQFAEGLKAAGIEL